MWGGEEKSARVSVLRTDFNTMNEHKTVLVAHPKRPLARHHAPVQLGLFAYNLLSVPASADWEKICLEVGKTKGSGKY